MIRSTMSLVKTKATTSLVSRSLSTGSQPPSTFKPYSLSSPSSAPLRNLSRHFSTDPHISSYERFMRRTPLNWGIRLVPEQEVCVVERFGKFHKVLEAGLHLLVPFVDRISYVHSMKEQTIEIPEQQSVTTDLVSVRVDGVLFVKIIDPEKASYGNANVMYSVIELAQTVMRTTISTMTLDEAFKERDTLNTNILKAMNDVASQWGLICCHYEIRDIIPHPEIREMMLIQAEAERRKRAEIIEAEGKRQVAILASEAGEIDSINRAAGVAEAVQIIGKSIQGDVGEAALRFHAVQNYLQAFQKIAETSSTIALPTAVGDDPSSIIKSALSLYKNVVVDKHGKDGDPARIKALADYFTNFIMDKHVKNDEKDKHGKNDEKSGFSPQSPKKN